MEEKNNPLLCDIETGICEIPDHKTATSNEVDFQSLTKPVKIIYYTDPIHVGVLSRNCANLNWSMATPLKLNTVWVDCCQIGVTAGAV